MFWIISIHGWCDTLALWYYLEVATIWNCSICLFFTFLSLWMLIWFSNLITQHMWDVSIFIAVACWVYLTPLFSFRLLMMNVGTKEMGLVAPLALLYHQKIIEESHTNKDNRCYLLYLKIITLHLSFPCIVCLLYHVYLLIIYIFFLSLVFIYYVEVAKNFEFSNFVVLCGSIPRLRGT